MSAKVIILNGVSSAGKSTLAKAIQEQASTTFLHIEMDAFIAFLPRGDELNPEWFKLEMISDPKGQTARISNGPKGEALLSVMRNFVIEAAQKGLNMVVDEVCHEAEVDVYRNGLSACDVQIVKVYAPIAVIEERERMRGNRIIGLARDQTSHLHSAIEYDLEVDTSSASAAANAEQILTRFS